MNLSESDCHSLAIYASQWCDVVIIMLHRACPDMKPPDSKALAIAPASHSHSDPVRSGQCPQVSVFKQMEQT